jgi:chromodomain-helicase-DNA-binding protein 7
MHNGFTGGALEMALVQFCANQSSLQPHEIEVLQNAIGVDDITTVTEDVAEAEGKFQPPLTDFTQTPENLVKRVIFYHRVDQVLAYVQDPLMGWPATGLDTDPLIDYAILYGIHINGLGNQVKVLTDVNLDVAVALTDKEICKLANVLVNAFIAEAETVRKTPPDIHEPLKWKEDHRELFSRDVFMNEELASLLQTVVGVGFPESKAGTVDWPFIAELSCLNCLSQRAFETEGAELFRLARSEMSADEENVLIERLGAYGNKVWVGRLRTNAHDMQGIRQFLAGMGDQEHEAMARMRTWDLAPVWWTHEHDLALLQAIAEFGVLYCAYWLIDPERLFAEHIPRSHMEDFGKAAKMERAKGRAQKPRDPGEFAFLFGEKARLARALLVVQFVESRVAKQKRREVGLSSAEAAGPFYVPEIFEIPPLPIDVGPQCRVMNLGQFHSSAASYPVGFISQRVYFSVNDPLDKTTYESTTELHENGALLFRVTDMEDRSKDYYHHTSSGAWEKLIADLQATRGKMRLPKRKGTSVSGPSMFGFSHPTISGCFKLLRTL